MYESEWKKFLIVLIGLLEILIFSGTILGWTSLKLMLKNEGIYDYLCIDEQQNNQNDENLTSTFNNETLSNEVSIETLFNNNETIQSDDDVKLLKSSTTTTTTTKTKNFTLKINFELINDDNDSRNDNLIKIPFKTIGIYNHSFIYQLINDTSLILKSSKNQKNDDNIKLIIIDDKLRNKSIFENYIDLYLQENFQSTINNIGSCKKQEITLNLAFSIGSFCMGAAAFIWGFLLERLGLRIVRLIINAMFAIGAFILCFIARGRDWLLFPALLIMSLSGVPIRIANMQISNLYPTKRSTIISLYSGAFSASSIIYVLLQYLYDQIDIKFFWIQFILVILSLMTIPFTMFILPMDKIRDPNLQQDKFSNKSINDNNNNNKLPIRLQNFKIINTSPIMNRKKSNNNNLKQQSYLNEAFESDINDVNSNSNISKTIENENKIEKLSSPPLWISLTTFAYNLHQIWFSWMITYMVMYVGSLDLWTKRVTEDHSDQSLYLNIYGLVQVLALIVSPIAGLLMDWQLSKTSGIEDKLEKRVKQTQSGFLPLFITSLTLLLCVICHYFDRSEFILLSIIFITIYRSFLLAVGSAFLRVRFHPDHFNQLLGIMSSISAVTSLLQIPLYSWEKNSESNVIYVNIVNTIIAFIIMLNPLYLLITPLQRYFLRKEMNQLDKYM